MLLNEPLQSEWKDITSSTKNSSKNDVWTDKELQECLKLYQKYGPNWKIISKKMNGKTDKQIMYKVNSVINEQKIRTNKEDDNFKPNEYYQEDPQEPNEEYKYFKKSSGKQYEDMLKRMNSDWSSKSNPYGQEFNPKRKDSKDVSSKTAHREWYLYNDYSMNDSRD